MNSGDTLREVWTETFSLEKCYIMPLRAREKPNNIALQKKFQNWKSSRKISLVHGKLQKYLYRNRKNMISEIYLCFQSYQKVRESTYLFNEVDIYLKPHWLQTWYFFINRKVQRSVYSWGKIVCWARSW